MGTLPIAERQPPGLRMPQHDPAAQVKVYELTDVGRYPGPSVLAYSYQGDDVRGPVAQPGEQGRAALEHGRIAIAYLRQRYAREQLTFPHLGVYLLPTPQDGGITGYSDDYNAVVLAAASAAHKENGRVVLGHASHSRDTVVHEIGHALIVNKAPGLTASLRRGNLQAAAIHEAFADLAAVFSQRNWTIGEDIVVPGQRLRYIRNIANPRDPAATEPLITSMAGWDKRHPERSEPHYGAGIVTNTAYRLQRQLGWQKTESLFDRVLDSGKIANATKFRDVATALRAQAAELWGAQARDTLLVDAELRRAGL